MRPDADWRSDLRNMDFCWIGNHEKCRTHRLVPPSHQRTAACNGVCTSLFMAMPTVVGQNSLTFNPPETVMARIPSFEDLLLEVQQSLGVEHPRLSTTPQKNRFADLAIPLDRHIETSRELLDRIFDVLGVDELARRDLSFNLVNLAGFNKALELRTWTGRASQQQVLWHLLAYSYIPSLARLAANWSFPGNGQAQPLDAGMPGGQFWFLPHWNRDANTLELPVPQVIDWLLDLLGCSIDQTGGLIGPQHRGGETAIPSIVRTLHNWRARTLPRIAKITEHLPDDASLPFHGVFEPDWQQPSIDLVQNALTFVQRKGLDVGKLQHEIPMAPEELEKVFAGTASEDEGLEFTHLLGLRYQKPDMATIRLRLRVARMVQDGYERLLKYLCPGVDKTCVDPCQNKLLQLIVLFEAVYNLTVAAHKNGETEAEENAWFEANLPAWDKEDLLLSIVPSRFATAYQELAHRLSRKFQQLSETNTELEDLVAIEPEKAGHIIESRCDAIEQEHDELVRLARLRERIRGASPWRALQSEDNFWVVSQIAGDDAQQLKVREMATERMRELTQTPAETVATLCNEVGRLLNCNPKYRPADAQAKVQVLLSEAEFHPGFESWKAVVLSLRAKHRLAQNDVTGARDDFKAVMDFCTENNCGGLRGEAGMNAWAIELELCKLNRQNQENYYRNMLGYMEFPQGTPSFEDAAARCEEYFWGTLYQPYAEIAPLGHGDLSAVLKETFGLIEKGDWNGLRAWLKRRAKDFRKKTLHSARCDSVLLQWMKFQGWFGQMITTAVLSERQDFANGIGKISAHRENRREAMRILLEEWPEQANLADFKGQTSLMLAADGGDVELVRLLLETGADVDAQDYLGRTGLHSAATGRSAKCAELILDRAPQVASGITYDEGNTALHTAVRMGAVDCVKLMADEFPSLVSQTNFSQKTPRDLTQEILEDVSKWQAFMSRKNRQTGTRQDFEAIATFLA